MNKCLIRDSSINVGYNDPFPAIMGHITSSPILPGVDVPRFCLDVSGSIHKPDGVPYRTKEASGLEAAFNWVFPNAVAGFLSYMLLT